jgi:hypothetical protein
MREEVEVISNANKGNKIVTFVMTSKVPRATGRDQIRKWL